MTFQKGTKYPTHPPSAAHELRKRYFFHFFNAEDPSSVSLTRATEKEL